MSRITDELSRLDGREMEEEERLLARQKEFAELMAGAQARISESLARLVRLKKQKRFLHEKGVKLVNEGLEEEERSRTAEVVQEVVSEESAGAAADPSFEGFDWNSLVVENEVIDWSGFLAAKPSGDTAAAPAGSSGGS